MPQCFLVGLSEVHPGLQGAFLCRDVHRGVRCQIMSGLALEAWDIVMAMAASATFASHSLMCCTACQ